MNLWIVEAKSVGDWSPVLYFRDDKIRSNIYLTREQARIAAKYMQKVNWTNISDNITVHYRASKYMRIE